jgi:hypothetical protein
MADEQLEAILRDLIGKPAEVPTTAPQPTPTEKKKGISTGLLIALIVIGGIAVVGTLLLLGGSFTVTGAGGGFGLGVTKADCPTPENSEPNTSRKICVGYKLDRIPTSDEGQYMYIEIFDNQNKKVQDILITLYPKVEWAEWFMWAGGSPDVIGGKVVFSYLKKGAVPKSALDIFWKYTVFVDSSLKACIYIPEKALRKVM